MSIMNRIDNRHRSVGFGTVVKTMDGNDGSVTTSRLRQEKSKKTISSSHLIPGKKISSNKKPEKNISKEEVEVNKQLVELITNNNDGEEEFNSMLTYDILTIDDPPSRVISDAQENNSKKTKFLSRIFGNNSGKKTHFTKINNNRNNLKNHIKRETRLPKALNSKLTSLEDLRYENKDNSSVWNTFPRSVSTLNVGSPPTYIPVFKRSSLNIFGSYGILPVEARNETRSSIPRLFNKEYLHQSEETQPVTDAQQRYLRYLHQAGVPGRGVAGPRSGVSARCHHSAPSNRRGSSKHRRSLPNFLEQFAEYEGKPAVMQSIR